MGRVVIPGFRKIETSGGGGEGGTTNYNDLTNKPFINNVPLVGNLNTVNLKLTDPTLTEEGVPAEAKTVGAKLEEQSTSLNALSEQLGKHTVKSDVPANAKFTDTTYNIATTTANGLMSKEHVSKLNNIQIKTYTSIESLGLSGTPTVNEIKLAMPLYSELLIEVNFLASKTDSEGNTLDNASCRIVKLDSDGRAWAEAHGKTDGKHYVMRLGKSDSAPNDFTEIWEQIAMNSDIKSYLPLSGGTITGAIKTSGNSILNTSTGGSTNFSGGTDLSNGATLILRGKDQGGTDSNGKFEIHAVTNKANSVLIGNPGGALDWSGTKICGKMLQLGSGNTITTDANNAYGLKFTYFTNPILQIIPTKDNVTNLGHSSSRFAEFRCNNIYTDSGTAVTSDKRYKNSISNLDDSLTSKFIMSLKPSSFKYNEGESGRTHYGLIAQDVEESMKNLGIDSTDFAGLVIEKLTKPVEVESIDENGKKVTQQQLEETGEIKYNLRYEEFIAPLIKTVQMQQKTIKNLEERLLKLENQILDNK